MCKVNIASQHHRETKQTDHTDLTVKPELRPAAAAVVSLCELLQVKEIMKICLSGYVHTAGAAI